jgi:hypothetical protein
LSRGEAELEESKPVNSHLDARILYELKRARSFHKLQQFTSFFVSVRKAEIDVVEIIRKEIKLLARLRASVRTSKTIKRAFHQELSRRMKLTMLPVLFPTTQRTTRQKCKHFNILSARGGMQLTPRGRPSPGLQIK